MQDGFSAFSAWVDSKSHFDPVVEQAPLKSQTHPSPSTQPGSNQISLNNSSEEPEASGVVEEVAEPQRPAINSTAAAQRLHYPNRAAFSVPALPVYQHQVQRGVDVLISRYLDMLPLAEVAKFEEPKGVGKLFVKLLCPPSNLAAWLRPLFLAVMLLAHLITAGCFVVVPAWLWAVKHVAEQNSEQAKLHAGALAVVGLLILLAADSLHRSSLRQRLARNTGLITAAQLGVYGRPPQKPVPSRKPAPPVTAVQRTGSTAAPATSVTAPADAAGTSSATTATANHRSTATTHAHISSLHRHRNATDEAQAHKVRELIIDLERTVYGNELTEGLLPAHVLPQRVQKLCEEVGVVWEHAAGVNATHEQLLDKLKAVQRELGL